MRIFRLVSIYFILLYAHLIFSIFRPAPTPLGQKRLPAGAPGGTAGPFREIVSRFWAMSYILTFRFTSMPVVQCFSARDFTSQKITFRKSPFRHRRSDSVDDGLTLGKWSSQSVSVSERFVAP